MRAGDRLKGRLKAATRRLAVSGPRSAPTPLILTYHSVGTRDHEMNVRPVDFEEQIRWLTDYTTVVSLEQAAGGRPGVALTFDDGYRDNLREAAPVLARYDLPATVFVVASRTGMYLDHDDRVPAAQLMTWEELAELARGGWSIGAHTMTHARLSRLTVPEQRGEIAGCKSAIERALGVEVKAFAYPFGSALDYTRDSVRLVREAGYAFAVSNRYGLCRPREDRWALRRIWIDRTDTLASFRNKVEGRLDRLAWLDSAAGIRARRVFNEFLGLG